MGRRKLKKVRERSNTNEDSRALKSRVVHHNSDQNSQQCLSAQSRRIGSHGHSHSSSSSSCHNRGSETNVSESEISDIPGYYYDAEKKRYFKILPNNMSSVSSFVTNETIQQKKEEERRLSSLKGKEGMKEVKLPLPSLHMPWKNNNLLTVLESLQCGVPTCSGFKRCIMGQMCKNLRSQPVAKGRDLDHLTPEMIASDGVAKFEFSEDRDKAAMVWTIQNSMLQYINLINFDVNSQRIDSERCKRRIIKMRNSGYVGKIVHKLTDMCWSPMPNFPGDQCLLYSTVCNLPNGASSVYIMNLEAHSQAEAEVATFSLGKPIAWSVSWNEPLARLSVGINRGCDVIDVHSRAKWTYRTMCSDTLAQRFCPTNQNILYAGTLNGKIIVLDTRTSNQGGSLRLNQKNSVCCLKFFNDDNYLLASDYSGLLVRMVFVRYGMLKVAQ